MNTDRPASPPGIQMLIPQRHFSGGLPRQPHARWAEALSSLQRAQWQGHAPSLAGAWLDVADLHLGAGSLGRAQQAWVQAQACLGAGSGLPSGAAAPGATPPSVRVDRSAIQCWQAVLQLEGLMLSGRLPAPASPSREGIALRLEDSLSTLPADEVLAAWQSRWPALVWSARLSRATLRRRAHWEGLLLQALSSPSAGHDGHAAHPFMQLHAGHVPAGLPPAAHAPAHGATGAGGIPARDELGDLHWAPVGVDALHDPWPWMHVRRLIERDLHHPEPHAGGGLPASWTALLSRLTPDWRWIQAATRGLTLTEWGGGETWAGLHRPGWVRWLHQLGPELEQAEPSWPLPPAPGHQLGEGPRAHVLPESPRCDGLADLACAIRPLLDEWQADWLVWWPADGRPAMRWDLLSHKPQRCALQVPHAEWAGSVQPLEAWTLHRLEDCPLPRPLSASLLQGANQGSALALGLQHGDAWHGLLWVGRDRWTQWHPLQSAALAQWVTHALGACQPATALAPMTPGLGTRTGGPAHGADAAQPPSDWETDRRASDYRVAGAVPSAAGAGDGDAGGAELKPGALDSLPEAWRERLQHAESLAVLGSLVGGFAHDLNSPLGVLLTSASMLQERAELIRDELERGALKRSAFQDFLGAALQSSQLLIRNTERAASLVKHFKRVAVDALASAHDRQALAGTADDLGALLRDTMASRGLTLQISGSWDAWYEGPPGALSQALLQLVRNAMDHAGLAAGDAVEVSAATEPAAGDHGVIVLRVTDHGSGMDAMAKSRAFERYFSRVVTQEEGASGLGLFLAHELVTRTLGGSCELLDTPGGGLTVQLTVPMMAD